MGVVSKFGCLKAKNIRINQVSLLARLKSMGTKSISLLVKYPSLEYPYKETLLYNNSWFSKLAFCRRIRQLAGLLITDRIYCRWGHMTAIFSPAFRSASPVSHWRSAIVTVRFLERAVRKFYPELEIIDRTSWDILKEPNVARWDGGVHIWSIDHVMRCSVLVITHKDAFSSGWH